MFLQFLLLFLLLLSLFELVTNMILAVPTSSTSSTSTSTSSSSSSSSSTAARDSSAGLVGSSNHPVDPLTQDRPRWCSSAVCDLTCLALVGSHAGVLCK